MIKIDNVAESGEIGQFRANAEQIGWRRNDGERIVVHPAGELRQAEWREGALRALFEDKEGGRSLAGWDGFDVRDTAVFDRLWRHFGDTYGVYIKKHKPVIELSAEDFDAAMRVVAEAADRVDEAAAGSVFKKAREADLMKRVEAVRDGMHKAVSGDKQALSRVFSENGCERIGRLRLVVDTVTLEVYSKDERWLHLSGMAATVESVLKELGTFKLWKPSEEEEDNSMVRRHMVRELLLRQGGDAGTLGEGPLSPSPAAEKAAVSKISTDGLPPPPLGGLLPQPPEEEPSPDRPQEEDDVSALPVAGMSSHQEEDWDVAVDNPNAVKASAPDEGRHRIGTLSSRETGGRRLHYMYPNSVLEGWVWKRSQYLKKWRRRWLVLTPDHLATYKQRHPGGWTERVEKGSVVTVCTADSEVLQTKSLCVVAHQRRTLGMQRSSLYMVCDDEAQKAQWIREIAGTLGTLQPR